MASAAAGGLWSAEEFVCWPLAGLFSLVSFFWLPSLFFSTATAILLFRNKPSSINWFKHPSTARSHACHNGWWHVVGNSGWLVGLKFKLLRIRSASKKFRNILATSKSCRKRRWNNGLGRTFHAIVSVIAVKIQLSSPRGVLRSASLLGMASAIVSGFSP